MTRPMPTLWADLPEPLTRAYEPNRPWALLDALEEILSALPAERIEIPLSPDVQISGHPIAIGRGARIHANSTIEGPVFLGRDVQVRPGAFIRGGCWIGDGAIVGVNTEVKRSILLPGARVPHLAYVGDSILGAGANLGAGTILSNFRHDGQTVMVPTPDGEPLDTGRRKLGAILGDRVKTGCNCVLHPGCVVGAGTLLYPGVHLRAGLYEAERIVKLSQELEIVPKR